MKLAELARDRLIIERRQVASVWAAQAAGDSVKHRRDCDVRAVLGVELRTLAAK